MRVKFISFFALTGLATLSGCGTSPRTQFITLSTVPPKTIVSYSGPSLIVGRVRLPPELDRLSLVRYLGDNQVDVNGVVQWAAPLDLLVRSALAQDIADRLPRGHVIIPGEVQPSGPAKVMVVTFAEFRISERGTVTLTAVWSLLNAATEKELTSQECTVHARAASATGGDIARAISVALGKLAEAMVVQITKPV